MKKTLFVLITVFLLLTSTLYSASDRPLGIDPKWDGISNPHPELKKIGDKFSFGINADPQVGHYEETEGLYGYCNYNISTTVRLLNRRQPNIDFLVYLGDIVNVPDEESFDNFMRRNADFDGLTIINHGNHDTIPPYTRFRDYQEKINGVRSVYYSFDVGKWHFITVPANNEFGNYDRLEVTEPMLEWLKKDLYENRNKPTMIFVHIHLMPQGLSQLEWYTHSPWLKHQFIEILSKYGNVKYFFNGHVHNGIKVALKTAWEYKGIKFMTLPSGTAPRPFGEEFPEFEEGLEKGGYYTIIDVDGLDVKITSKNVYSEAEFVYPDSFQEFDEDIEPRLLNKVIDFPATAKVVNPGFEEGLDSWYTPFRYNCDGLETGFLNEWRMKHKRNGRHSAYVYAKPLGSNWLQDEYNEFYQIVEAPKGGDPVFTTSYFLEEEIERGGGYCRVIAVGGPEGEGDFKFLMQFDFTKPEHEYYGDYYPRAMGYTIQGRVSSWMYLQELGKKKKGLFFRIPLETGAWHDLQANIADIYDKAMGKRGAYDQLGVTRFVVGAGVFCVKDVQRGAGAYLDDINLIAMPGNTPSLSDGKPIKVDASVFETTYGQWLKDDLEKRKKNN